MPDAPKKAKNNEPLVYVIAGQDDALVSSRCTEIVDKLVDPSQRATGVFSPQDDMPEVCEVLDELRTAPFLIDKRVVVLKQADAFVSKNRELLEKYFDNPCLTGRLILAVKTWDARTKLAKKLPAVGTLITLTPPKRWDIPKYLIQYALQTWNKNLRKEAAELIIELTGDEMARLYSEVDKLALYSDSNREITCENVESLLGNNRLFNAFAVIDAVINSDAATAVNRLRAMFEADKTSEYTTVGAFAFHFRRMFKAKTMLDKGINYGDIEKKCMIWSNKEQFFSQLRKTPLQQIGLYLKQLAETDYAIKTGRTKAPVAMEQFVINVIKVTKVS
jgi:DNA polymerase III subunit delta